MSDSQNVIELRFIRLITAAQIQLLGPVLQKPQAVYTMDAYGFYIGNDAPNEINIAYAQEYLEGLDEILNDFYRFGFATKAEMLIKPFGIDPIMAEICSIKAVLLEKEHQKYYLSFEYDEWSDHICGNLYPMSIPAYENEKIIELACSKNHYLKKEDVSISIINT